MQYTTRNESNTFLVSLLWFRKASLLKMPNYLFTHVADFPPKVWSLLKFVVANKNVHTFLFFGISYHKMWAIVEAFYRSLLVYSPFRCLNDRPQHYFGQVIVPPNRDLG
ncbi:MAG: hypothetical protein JNM36_08805 [Chitinophagales bacterium]|nr:hypothetical protein [Chitinophagales bacterium]